jgi:hypothetical protein
VVDSLEWSFHGDRFHHVGRAIGRIWGAKFERDSLDFLVNCSLTVHEIGLQNVFACRTIGRMLS